jgi:hypothetical protein
MKATWLGGFSAVAISLVVGGASLHASALYVQNFSFETPALSPNNAANDDAPGYTVITGSQSGSYTGVFNPPASAVPYGVPDGSQVLFTEFGSPGVGSTPAGVSQGLVNSAIDSTPYSIVAGDTYTLSVYAARRGDSNNDPASFSIYLSAGGAEVGTAATGSTGDAAFATAGTFVDETATYTAPSIISPGTQLGLVIEQTGGTQESSQVLFDDVTVNATAVPEPASCAIVTLATSLLCLRRRRAV